MSRKIKDYEDTPSFLEQESMAEQKIKASEVQPEAAKAPTKLDEIDEENPETNWGKLKKNLRMNREMEKEALANLPNRRKKAAYMVYYHKWQVLISLLVIVGLVYFVHALATRKQYAYNFIYLGDAYNQDASDYFEDQLNQVIDYNHKKQKVVVNAYPCKTDNYDPGYYGGDTGTQQVFSLMTSRLVDTITADKKTVEWFCEDDNLCDLSTVLPGDLYSELKPYIVKMKNKSGQEGEYALDISKTKFFRDSKSKLKTPVIGIFNISDHMDDDIALIRHIYNLEQ